MMRMMMMMMMMMMLVVIVNGSSIIINNIITIYLSIGMSDALVTIIGAGKMARLLLIHLQTQGKDVLCCRCLAVIRP